MTAVLVTRPLTVAETTITALNNLGYTVSYEPLLTVKATRNARPGTIVQAVVITSRNALWALGKTEDISDLFDRPCLCIGARTAHSAASFGFRCVHFQDAKDTLTAPFLAEKSVSPPSSILHIAGAYTASSSLTALMEAGYQIIPWHVYEAQEVDQLTAALQQRLIRKQIDAVLFFSPHTASVFVDLAAQHKLEACCKSLTAIGISEAVCKALKPLSWRHLAAAEAPTEDAVIASLQRLCPVF